MQSRKIKSLPQVLLIAFAIGAFGCRGTSAESETDEAVIAAVGDRVIFASDFAKSFEFGHAQLKKLPDARRGYLRLMMLESALAQEAERIGLDTTASIQNAIRTLSEELLIERIFENEVVAGISVSEEEIAEAVNRSAVNIKFRFLPAWSEVEATRLRGVVLEAGFEAALEAVAETAELPIVREELESPFVSVDEIEPDVLLLLENLEMGIPSDPVRRDGMWFIFEVVDIRREMIGPDDYEARAASAKKLIRNRKAVEGAAEFVSAVMTPLDVRTKRDAFVILDEALWSWYSTSTPVYPLDQYLYEQELDAPFAEDLRRAAVMELVTFGGNAWTLADFYGAFTPGRYVLRADERSAFTASLADIVALVVRDHVLMETAHDRGLGFDPLTDRESQQWVDKWRYRAIVRYELGAQPDRNRLHAFADSLLDRLDAHINEGVLAAADVDDDPANAISVHLVKSNSNKPAFPVVDPTWVF